MSDNTYDFVHLALHALGDSVDGKTLLQKKVYFLGVLTGKLDDLGYRAHFYGPYSADVADAIGSLASLGFVDAQASSWGVDSRGFELSKTTYTLTGDGIQVAEQKAHRNAELWEKLNQACEFLKKAGNLDYIKMSIAAKTFFLIKTANSVLLSDLVSKAKNFGWNITDQQIGEAVEFLKQLKLITIVEHKES